MKKAKAIEASEKAKAHHRMECMDSSSTKRGASKIEAETQLMITPMRSVRMPSGVKSAMYAMATDIVQLLPLRAKHTQNTYMETEAYSTSIRIRVGSSEISEPYCSAHRLPKESVRAPVVWQYD